MDIKTTKAWMDSIFNINKELDYERRNIETSLARVEKIETKKEELFYVISAIKNPTYKAVLHMRYIEGRKWEDIALTLNYTEQHIHRLKNEAYVEVYKIRKKQGE